GIGLTVEEALIFWRKSFSSITDEKFQKEYAYNIRHNQHGCPFKHFSEDNLKVFLTQTGVKKDEHLKAILDIVKGKHYQVACTKYFEITKCLEDSISRGDDERHLMETIKHPNNYFEQSVKLSKINNSQN
ncbi:9512_t:CDS:2, partial [Gigaspora rosea]